MAKKDNRIKKYTKKDGTTAYMFKAYLGIDQQTGKAIRTTRRGFKSPTEAKTALKKIEYEATQGDVRKEIQNNLTFQDVYDEWFPGYINTVRESTWYKRKKMFENHILPIFGKYRIRTITTSQIQKALNKWFKETTYNYKPWFNYTNKVFKYAILQRYIDDNPATRVIMPKKTEFEDKTPNFWSKEQLQVFFNYIDPIKDLEKYTLFRVLAFTGIRRAECLALTWDDFNAQKKTLSINKTLAQGIKGKLRINNTKTKKGTRDISLDDLTVKTLQKWHIKERSDFFKRGINIDHPNQLIFPSTKNTFKSLNTPRKWYCKVMDQIENDNVDLPRITIHGFRHTHASALFAAGASIKEVQERLGHEDAQTTLNIYTHVTEKQDKEVAKKLVNYLNF
ncbi:MAG TPA: site-specific integrase [Companilactobacillus farciminis]|uniref:Site-specific integrase n=1 Tax=Companilactobacillus farciminis TaxID=1612 RepID=A0A921HSU3_9LACO|nr:MULTISPECIES: site-specific integrase [Companilactobacillus]MDG5113497.1 tyrosine-type recombinase/integrase [Companilactobacillus pabuli]WCG34788.1 tyrosine-type recombinase/integrase [Companilactobacillus farciminis]HJF87321.1 site-specific integrase [Companilactobacillus farciminis]